MASIGGPAPRKEGVTRGKEKLWQHLSQCTAEFFLATNNTNPAGQSAVPWVLAPATSRLLPRALLPVLASRHGVASLQDTMQCAALHCTAVSTAVSTAVWMDQERLRPEICKPPGLAADLGVGSDND
jgi:hypothetical protein